MCAQVPWTSEKIFNSLQILTISIYFLLFYVYYMYKWVLLSFHCHLIELVNNMVWLQLLSIVTWDGTSNLVAKRHAYYVVFVQYIWLNGGPFVVIKCLCCCL